MEPFSALADSPVAYDSSELLKLLDFVYVSDCECSSRLSDRRVEQERSIQTEQALIWEFRTQRYEFTGRCECGSRPQGFYDAQRVVLNDYVLRNTVNAVREHRHFLFGSYFSAYVDRELARSHVRMYVNDTILRHNENNPTALPILKDAFCHACDALAAARKKNMEYFGTTAREIALAIASKYLDAATTVVISENGNLNQSHGSLGPSAQTGPSLLDLEGSTSGAAGPVLLSTATDALNMSTTSRHVHSASNAMDALPSEHHHMFVEKALELSLVHGEDSLLPLIPRVCFRMHAGHWLSTLLLVMNEMVFRHSAEELRHGGQWSGLLFGLSGAVVAASRLETSLLRSDVLYPLQQLTEASLTLLEKAVGPFGEDFVKDTVYTPVPLDALVAAARVVTFGRGVVCLGWATVGLLSDVMQSLLLAPSRAKGVLYPLLPYLPWHAPFCGTSDLESYFALLFGLQDDVRARTLADAPPSERVAVRREFCDAIVSAAPFVRLSLATDPIGIYLPYTWLHNGTWDLMQLRYESRTKAFFEDARFLFPTLFALTQIAATHMGCEETPILDATCTDERLWLGRLCVEELFFLSFDAAVSVTTLRQQEFAESAAGSGGEALVTVMSRLHIEAWGCLCTLLFFAPCLTASVLSCASFVATHADSIPDTGLASDAQQTATVLSTLLRSLPLNFYPPSSSSDPSANSTRSPPPRESSGSHTRGANETFPSRTHGSPGGSLPATNSETGVSSRELRIAANNAASLVEILLEAIGTCATAPYTAEAPVDVVADWAKVALEQAFRLPASCDPLDASAGVASLAVFSNMPWHLMPREEGLKALIGFLGARTLPTRFGDRYVSAGRQVALAVLRARVGDVSIFATLTRVILDVEGNMSPRGTLLQMLQILLLGDRVCSVSQVSHVSQSAHNDVATFYRRAQRLISTEDTSAVPAIVGEALSTVACSYATSALMPRAHAHVSDACPSPLDAATLADLAQPHFPHAVELILTLTVRHVSTVPYVLRGIVFAAVASPNRDAAVETSYSEGDPRQTTTPSGSSSTSSNQWRHSVVYFWARALASAHQAGIEGRAEFVKSFPDSGRLTSGSTSRLFANPGKKLRETVGMIFLHLLDELAHGLLMANFEMWSFVAGLRDAYPYAGSILSVAAIRRMYSSKIVAPWLCVAAVCAREPVMPFSISVSRRRSSGSISRIGLTTRGDGGETTYDDDDDGLIGNEVDYGDAPGVRKASMMERLRRVSLRRNSLESDWDASLASDLTDSNEGAGLTLKDRIALLPVVEDVLALHNKNPSSLELAADAAFSMGAHAAALFCWERFFSLYLGGQSKVPSDSDSPLVRGVEFSVGKDVRNRLSSHLQEMARQMDGSTRPLYQLFYALSTFAADIIGYNGRFLAFGPGAHFDTLRALDPPPFVLLGHQPSTQTNQFVSSPSSDAHVMRLHESLAVESYSGTNMPASGYGASSLGSVDDAAPTDLPSIAAAAGLDPYNTDPQAPFAAETGDTGYHPYEETNHSAMADSTRPSVIISESVLPLRVLERSTAVGMLLPTDRWGMDDRDATALLGMFADEAHSLNTEFEHTWHAIHRNGSLEDMARMYENMTHARLENGVSAWQWLQTRGDAGGAAVVADWWKNISHMPGYGDMLVLHRLLEVLARVEDAFQFVSTADTEFWDLTRRMYSNVGCQLPVRIKCPSGCRKPIHVLLCTSKITPPASNVVQKQMANRIEMREATATMLQMAPHLSTSLFGLEKLKERMLMTLRAQPISPRALGLNADVSDEHSKVHRTIYSNVERHMHHVLASPEKRPAVTAFFALLPLLLAPPECVALIPAVSRNVVALAETVCQEEEAIRNNARVQLPLVQALVCFFSSPLRAEDQPGPIPPWFDFAFSPECLRHLQSSILQNFPSSASQSPHRKQADGSVSLTTLLSLDGNHSSHDVPAAASGLLIDFDNNPLVPSTQPNSSSLNLPSSQSPHPTSDSAGSDAAVAAQGSPIFDSIQSVVFPASQGTCASDDQLPVGGAATPGGFDGGRVGRDAGASANGGGMDVGSSGSGGFVGDNIGGGAAAAYASYSGGGGGETPGWLWQPLSSYFECLTLVAGTEVLPEAWVDAVLEHCDLEAAMDVLLSVSSVYGIQAMNDVNAQRTCRTMMQSRMLRSPRFQMSALTMSHRLVGVLFPTYLPYVTDALLFAAKQGLLDTSALAPLSYVDLDALDPTTLLYLLRAIARHAPYSEQLLQGLLSGFLGTLISSKNTVLVNTVAIAGTRYRAHVPEDHTCAEPEKATKSERDVAELVLEGLTELVNRCLQPLSGTGMVVSSDNSCALLHPLCQHATNGAWVPDILWRLYVDGGVGEYLRNLAQQTSISIARNVVQMFRLAGDTWHRASFHVCDADGVKGLVDSLLDTGGVAYEILHSLNWTPFAQRLREAFTEHPLDGSSVEETSKWGSVAAVHALRLVMDLSLLSPRGAPEEVVDVLGLPFDESCLSGSPHPHTCETGSVVDWTKIDQREFAKHFDGTALLRILRAEKAGVEPTLPLVRSMGALLSAACTATTASAVFVEITSSLYYCFTVVFF
eukprot:Rmarinus@m.14773